MDPTHHLRTKDAVDLASAWVSHRSRALGVRALVIKGPIAGQLGLRATRTSADVDLLVEPDGIAGLVDHLSGLGWHERPADVAPRIVEAHSVSLIHDHWPIDLDVHAFWPGFLGDPAEVFDLLWQDRIESELARVPVMAPGLESGALILALHSLRRPLGRDSGRVDELTTLATATRALLGAAAGERLLHTALRLGATQTAAPFLRLLGVDVPEDPNPSRDLQLWQLKAGTRGNVTAWLLEFRSEHGIGRLRVARRALVPAPSELRQLHPELPPGIRGLALGWAGRWHSGLVELPRTVHTLKTITRRPSRADEPRRRR